MVASILRMTGAAFQPRGGVVLLAVVGREADGLLEVLLGLLVALLPAACVAAPEERAGMLRVEADRLAAFRDAEGVVRRLEGGLAAHQVGVAADQADRLCTRELLGLV